MATTSGLAANTANSEHFEQLHRQLLADPSLQFRIEHTPPPKPPEWLSWLEPLADLIKFISPVLGYVFWAGVIVIAGMIAYAILNEVLRRLPRNAPASSEPFVAPEPQFRPAAARAHALLEEADRLAREGRFAEAVRILLHRSIEDMEQAFPAAIAPSMTSREISKLQYLSAGGRATFTKIAEAVEASLFGGRALNATHFADCRAAYSNFVFEAPSK
ncbi:MAG: hypothetical protein K8S25_07175 [Alphaproteobacteria bacterium]|nr:hypothetical protein [Alphaproteobacteria bacterium]